MKTDMFAESYLFTINNVYNSYWEQQYCRLGNYYMIYHQIQGDSLLSFKYRSRCFKFDHKFSSNSSLFSVRLSWFSRWGLVGFCRLFGFYPYAKN